MYVITIPKPCQGPKNGIRQISPGSSECHAFRGVTGIVFCEKIVAVLIHADAFSFRMYRKRTMQAFRHPKLELPGILRRVII